MLSEKRQDRSSVVMVMLAISSLLWICDRGSRLTIDFYPTAFAFMSGNRARNKQFFLNRSMMKNTPSPLFSMEPASNSRPGSPPTAPTANVINGASSLEASFDASSGDTATSGAPSTSLLDRVRQMSNFASCLCVLDCTLLPLVTVALPLLGVLNLGAGKLQAIDNLGHSLALYFVLPVGSLTTGFNYVSHKKKWISALAILGLIMVGIANSHIHVHHSPTLWKFSVRWIGTVLNKIQGCGTSPWHRIVNVSGCALLLGSNYLSQQQDGCIALAKSSDCGHDHDNGGCNH